MKKKLLVMTILALALPLTAFADNNSSGAFSTITTVAQGSGGSGLSFDSRFSGKHESSSSGNEGVTVTVPEPGELSLMGMGLLGLVGAIRRKIKR